VCLKIYIFSANPEDDVAKVLAELETNKSHGPDNIPPIILKQKKIMQQSLTQLKLKTHGSIAESKYAP